MTFVHPFVTKRFIAHAGDLYSRRLSLAVSVTDAFTGKQPSVPLRVLLKELPRARTLHSLSGFFGFEDIENGNYTLVVEPDPTTADWFYLQPQAGEDWTDKFERPVTLPLPNQLSPLVIVTLSPKTSYPFPVNATLIRGTVTKEPPNPEVAGAIVRSAYKQVNPNDVDQPPVTVVVETQSNHDGEYVLFFQKLPGRTQQVILTALSSGQQVQQPVLITEGTMKKADPLHFP
jgi:hypothetical protein